MAEKKGKEVVMEKEIQRASFGLGGYRKARQKEIRLGVWIWQKGP